MAKKNKTLMLFNGRDQRTFRGTMYVAAYCRSSASRYILKVLDPNYDQHSTDGYRRKQKMNRELREYWNDSGWGNNLNHITPEAGMVWATDPNGNNLIRLDKP